MKQMTFADAEYAGKRKQTRKELFLIEMDRVVPWKGLIALIEPHYPKGEGGRPAGTVAKLAMRQPFVLFKGLTFQKLCLPGAFRPGDHHNKMLRPGLCVVHASPQYL
ncbi:hypothetical protein MBS10_005519 [Klebsiella pneumoniae]|nr:hypothetical protein [Klebsiella pneumoniae]